MRRKDREITDFDQIVNIIDECDVVRLGLADGDFPYIVPVNFGYQVDGEQIYLYFHGAMAGRKYELLNRNMRCSFEMDNMMLLECITESRDVTTRYKSVMGTAEAEFLQGEEKQAALDRFIMGRYDKTKNFDYNRANVERTAIVRLKVIDISAKVNPIRVAE